MDSKQFANAVAQLLPRAQVAASPENVQVLGQLYDTLGKMARGELILTPIRSVENPPAED